MEITHIPDAKAGMLIRRPAAVVFEAFVDPAITSKFWFTHGTGRLDQQRQVKWDWEMYGASVNVNVQAIEQNKRILIEWSGYDTPTTVEWIFTARPDDTTFVDITESGFKGDGDTLVTQAISSTEAFTLVLAGAKALLEHNIRLNLVPDRFPDGIANHKSISIQLPTRSRIFPRRHSYVHRRKQNSRTPIY